MKRADLDSHYTEQRAGAPDYQIYYLECVYCPHTEAPIRSMGNFGRVQNMRKRMRDHILAEHQSVLRGESAIA